MPPDTDHSHARDGLRPGDGSLGDSPLAHYLHALWRFRWLLAGGSVLAAAVTYVVALTLTPRFEASAVIMVTASKTGEQVASGLDVRNFRAFVQNQTLAAEIIKEFALNLTPQRFLDDHVNVQEVRGTNLLTVSVTAANPDLAARIANAMSNRAVALSRSVEQAEAVVARDVIKGQLDAARDRLTQSRATLETYQRQAQVELLEKRINVLTDQQADIQTLTVELEGQRAYLRQAEQDLAQQDRVRGVQRSVQLQAPKAVDDDTRQERARRAETAERPPARTAARESDSAGADQADARPAPEPARPRRQEPDQQPPAAPELRDALIDPYINPSFEILQQQVTAARSRVAQLERKRAEMLKSRSADGQLPALADFYTRKARQTELEMQQELAEKLYVDVATRFEQARLQIASRSAQLQVLDPALPPDRKVYPREKLMASAALVLTLSLLTAGVVAVTGIGKALDRGRREPAV